MSIPPSPCPHSSTRLVYFHHVGLPLGHYTSICVDDFVEALDLMEAQADIVGLGDYLAETEAISVSAAPRRVVLTFDDGYAETIETVVPILESRGLAAVFFVVPSWVGAKAPHAWAPETLRCATWESLAAVQAQGHIVANHTWSHARLDTLAPDVAASEILRGQEALEAHGLGLDFGGSVAYPYGRSPRPGGMGSASLGFSTARPPVGCIHCSPQRISRVYLDSYDKKGWSNAISSWW